MSSRSQQLEITKTRMGSRLCLEVPQRKLGAVLCAIGSALDGHPWTPYRDGKSRSRGRRGGKNTREKGVGKVVHENGTSPSTSLATKQPSLPDGVVVCSKGSSTQIQKVSTQNRSQSSVPLSSGKPKTFVVKNKVIAAVETQALPSEVKQASVQVIDSTVAPVLPTVVPGGRMAPKPSTPVATGQIPPMVEAVDPSQYDEVKLVGELRKRQVLAKKVAKNMPNKPATVHAPEQEVISKNFLGGEKRVANPDYDKQRELYRVYTDSMTKWYADCKETKSFNDDVSEHNRAMDYDHFAECGFNCKCNARRDPVYLSLLNAFNNRGRSQPRRAVERQRQPASKMHGKA